MTTRTHTALAVALLAGGAGCQLVADIQELPGPPTASDGGALPSAPDGGALPSAPPSPSGAGVSVTGPPSCTPPSLSCGPTGASDCCDAPPLPAGSFLRDYDAKDFTDSSHHVTLSPFRLDRFEVTVGRFRTFVAAYYGGWQPAPGVGKNPSNPGDGGWRTDWSANLPTGGAALEASLACSTQLHTYTGAAAANELRPINCVTWYVAFAFCAWDGGRLPTDSEWEYAAAGGDEERYYPWDDPRGHRGQGGIDDSRASYYVDDQRKCFGDQVAGCALTDLTAVGTHPAGIGKWGHDDLAGNAAEWVRDGDGSTANDCVDCFDPTDKSGVRRVRGGAFDSPSPGALRVAAYNTNDPGTPSERIGFRCAR